MIVSLVLHAFRVFFTGTYRKPRELTWVLGVVLLDIDLGGQEVQRWEVSAQDFGS
jgi:quinol-cytochrome oxidoreductase complex cytochrome b subunit